MKADLAQKILHMRDKQNFTYERIATELGLSNRERARQKYIKAKRLYIYTYGPKR